MRKLQKPRLFIVGIVLGLLLFPVTATADLITVAPGGRYFQRGEQAFLIIGVNDALTWPGLSPLLGKTAPHAAEDYLKKLAEKGINTLRVMIEYAQFPYGLLENPLGEYRSDVVEFWDDFFNLLETYDLYAIVTPWDPFWMERTWPQNPYNTENGGFMRSMHGFLTEPQGIEAQKERFRFMIDRWGWSKRILAWELMNEIELWWGATSGEIRQWITELADYVREYQQEKHGFTQLITVSSASFAPSGTLGEVIYNHPKLDFATTHLYTGPGMNAPRDTTRVASEVAMALNYAYWQIKDRRPYTDTESGPIEMWIGSPSFDAEYLHNVSWAHLAGGGAGTGMRWPYRSPHILTDGMLDVLGRIGKFATAFDFGKFVPDTIYQDLQPQSGYEAIGISDEQRILIWLLRKAEIQGDAAETILHLSYIIPGKYQVTYWDTWEATWLHTEELNVEDYEFSLTTPPFTKDIAIVLELDRK